MHAKQEIKILPLFLQTRTVTQTEQNVKNDPLFLQTNTYHNMSRDNQCFVELLPDGDLVPDSPA